MDYRFLKCSCERKGVVVLTISSPATLNALNSTILEELDAFVDALDPAVTRVLVITGEGRLDSQTAKGKAPVGVARIAKMYGKPVIAFAGSIREDAEVLHEHGIDAFFSILRESISPAL